MVTLHGMRIAVFAADGVESVVLERVWAAVEDHGGHPELLASTIGYLQAAIEPSQNSHVLIDQLIATADPGNYSGLIILGARTDDDSPVDNDAVAWVGAFGWDQKPIAIVGYGVRLLIGADLVRNRNVAAPSALRDQITTAGGQWCDQGTVRDDQLLSARSGADLELFCQELVELLYAHHHKPAPSHNGTVAAAYGL